MRYHIPLFIVLALIVIGACTQLNPRKVIVEECESLGRDSLKDSCYAQLGILRGDLNLCDSARTDESKFFCYDGIAEATNASSICEQITSNYWRPICFRNVGVNTNNLVLCNEVADGTDKTDCIRTIAQATSNATICRQIADEFKPERIGCITNIAVAQKSVHPCFDIDKATLERDQCLYQAAKAIADPSLCNHLEFTSTKQICFERVKEIADQLRAAKAMNQSNSTS